MNPKAHHILPGRPRVIGRYALHAELASGGMATFHVGRMFGPAGFQRTVAIKRLLPNLAREPEFVARFLDEARIAARIRHQNVVPTLDVVAADGEIFLVMEYVEGEPLSRLMRMAPQNRLPVDVACAIAEAMLAGLHAAHEARDERGSLLQIVHRDVSPQNVIVGTDGVARMLDFGIAKAVGRAHITRDGAIRGKFGYMAPEQLAGHASQASDIYAVAVVLWECLTGKKYYRGDTDAALIADILSPPMTRVRSIVPEVSQALDDAVLRALSLEPDDRYGDAREMALELSRAVRSASAMRVATFVQSLAADSLAARARLIAEVECTPFDRISSTRIHAAGPSGSAAKRTLGVPSQGPSTGGGVTSEARPTSSAKGGARPLYVGMGVAAFALTAFATGLAFERAWPRPPTAREQAPAVAVAADPDLPGPLSSASNLPGPPSSASNLPGPLSSVSTPSGPPPGVPTADAPETRPPAVARDPRPSADSRARPKRPASAGVRPVASTLVDTSRLPADRE